MTINQPKNAQSARKTFFSLKNNIEFPYRTEAERLIMACCEFDQCLDAYEPFEFQMRSFKNSRQLETSIAFKLDYEDSREFIILSDRLASNKWMADGIRRQLQQSERKRIKLTVRRPAQVETDVLAQNVLFLYQFAVFAPPLPECARIRDYTELVGDCSLDRLKTILQTENAIYYLLFHGGLRADLSVAPLTGNTLVSSGPLINTILKTLANAVAGGAA